MADGLPTWVAEVMSTKPTLEAAVDFVVQVLSPSWVLLYVSSGFSEHRQTAVAAWGALCPCWWLTGVTVVRAG